MGHLFLALLGPPDIRHAERPLVFATRKTQALLIYLVVEGGSHSRDKLAALLWPESGTAQARTTLHSTLSLLRDALGESGIHLQATRDMLGFDAASDYASDVQELRAAAHSARDPDAPALIARSELHMHIDRLKAATMLYRADFLDGFSLGDALEFDDWAMLQRESLHRAVVLVFDVLSRLQLDSGAAGDAVETAGRWLAHDRLSEPAYCRPGRRYRARTGL